MERNKEEFWEKFKQENCALCSSLVCDGITEEIMEGCLSYRNAKEFLESEE